ncbi:MAG: nucleotidyltransferase domain-containing protein [Clostridiales Family XIII bacterium]|jgi:predicted nucleotidyltransferase|nr:nucleotidyltransferase domain-containing protein [Clostridiales Family XIII bacterium]
MNNDINTREAYISGIVPKITSVLPVSEMYLFGSSARGDITADSDVDVYVVIDDDYTGSRYDAAGAAITAIRSDDNYIATDIIVHKKSDFEWRKDKFVLERVMMREGVKLYG